MKKLACTVALVVAVAALPTVSSAQENQFKVGSRVAAVGVLMGGTSYTYGSGGIGIGGSFEVGIKEIADQVRLGVGGFVGYQKSDGGILVNTYDVSSTTIAGFVNGHYQLTMVPKLDLYAGPVFGINRQSLDYTRVCASCESSSSDPAIGVQVGARYEIAPRIMGSLQLSGGTRLPWANFGVAFKL